MMIFCMNLEVLCKIFDALTQERDLHFRRAGIALMDPELLDNPLLLLWSNSHVLRFFSLSFLLSMFSSIVTQYCKATTTPDRLGGSSVSRFDGFSAQSAGPKFRKHKENTRRTFFCRGVMLKSLCEN